MTPDEQEALSRKYSDDVILLLPLKSGSWAVLNNARELCGFLNEEELFTDMLQDRLNGVWHRPIQLPTKKNVYLGDEFLKELGLL